MRNATGELEFFVRVKDRDIDEYQHNGKTYVEGRKGSAYQIVMRNRSARNALFVAAVDGKSIIDGKPASSQSPGYIVEAFRTVVIDGWKVNGATGARFEFGSDAQSYTAQMGDEAGMAHLGFIAAQVFFEKPKPKPIIRPRHPETVTWEYNGIYGSGATPRSWGTKEKGRGVSEVMRSAMDRPMFGANEGIGSAMAGSLSSSTASINTMAIEQAAMAAAQSIKSAVLDAQTTFQNSVEPEERLGTKFGEAIEMRTTTATFDREPTPVVSFVIEYKTRRDLERMGIRFAPEVAVRSPFPGDQGCPTPQGWGKR